MEEPLSKKRTRDEEELEDNADIRSPKKLKGDAPILTEEYDLGVECEALARAWTTKNEAELLKILKRLSLLTAHADNEAQLYWSSILLHIEQAKYDSLQDKRKHDAQVVIDTRGLRVLYELLSADDPEVGLYAFNIMCNLRIDGSPSEILFRKFLSLFKDGTKSIAGTEFTILALVASKFTNARRYILTNLLEHFIQCIKSNDKRVQCTALSRLSCILHPYFAKALEPRDKIESLITELYAIIEKNYGEGGDLVLFSLACKNFAVLLSDASYSEFLEAKLGTAWQTRFLNIAMPHLTLTSPVETLRYLFWCLNGAMAVYGNHWFGHVEEFTLLRQHVIRLLSHRSRRVLVGITGIIRRYYQIKGTYKITSHMKSADSEVAERGEVPIPFTEAEWAAYRKMLASKTIMTTSGYFPLHIMEGLFYMFRYETTFPRKEIIHSLCNILEWYHEFLLYPDMHHRNTEIDIGKVQLLIKILSEGTEEDLALFILHPAALRLPELRRGFWAQMKAAIQAKPGIMALLRNYILAGEETSAKHCQVIWSRVKKGKASKERYEYLLVERLLNDLIECGNEEALQSIVLALNTVGTKHRKTWYAIAAHPIALLKIKLLNRSEGDRLIERIRRIDDMEAFLKLGTLSDFFKHRPLLSWDILFPGCGMVLPMCLPAVANFPFEIGGVRLLPEGVKELQLCVENQTLRCHQSLLASFSTVFANQFEVLPPDETPIPVDHIGKFEVIEKMIEFCYGLTEISTIEMLAQLIVAADYAGMHKLRATCVKLLGCVLVEDVSPILPVLRVQSGWDNKERESIFYWLARHWRMFEGREEELRELLTFCGRRALNDDGAEEKEESDESGESSEHDSYAESESE